MGFPILVRRHLYIESGPWPLSNHKKTQDCATRVYNSWNIPLPNLNPALNTETDESERSSGWLPWSSLVTLKLAFNVYNDGQGNHPDISVSMNWWSDALTSKLMALVEWIYASFNASMILHQTVNWLISPWTKWPPFWQTTYSIAFKKNENERIPIQISLKSVPRSPIDNKAALVQVMAWCRTGEKPIPGPMIRQFFDAYRCGSRGRWIIVIPASHCPSQWMFNTLTPRKKGRHFADDIFKCISLNQNVWISLKISLQFVTNGFELCENDTDICILIVCKHHLYIFNTLLVVMHRSRVLISQVFSLELCQKW